MNRSVEFFASQFDRQIANADYALNPFERRALPYCHGRLIDLGCGLGNLAIAAAKAGARVTALDACPRAIEDVNRRAAEAGLPIDARAEDLSRWRADDAYDTVVSIGLLMFFPCNQATAMLEELRKATVPSGTLVLNVLVEGTTYMQMFDGDRYCLFNKADLQRRFSDWQLLESAVEEFPAGDGLIKRFATLVARRPPAITQR